MTSFRTHGLADQHLFTYMFLVKNVVVIKLFHRATYYLATMCRTLRGRTILLRSNKISVLLHNIYFLNLRSKLLLPLIFF